MISSIAFRGGETAGSVADRIDSRQETAGSVADRIDSRQETAGSVALRHRAQAPEGQIKTLDKDTVSFQGKDDNKKSGLSALGTIIVSAGALAAVVGAVGLLHKHGAVDKISNEKCRNFVTKYISKPAYEACKFVKKYAVQGWNWLKGAFKHGDGAASETGAAGVPSIVADGHFFG